MRAANPYCEDDQKLTKAQKDEILHSHNEALRDEVVDALTAIEDMRRHHNL